MKKESFKYLYSFKYNNKEYIYLISKNYPFYYLEYNLITNNFDYPDVDTFKELYTKFHSNNTILYFNIKPGLKQIKKGLLDLNIDIIPLIKTTSGLISAALVLSMCGCTSINHINNASDIESSVIEVEDKSKEICDYFKSYSMDVTVKEYDNNNYIFVNEFINNNNKHQITLKDLSEFKKFNNIY